MDEPQCIIEMTMQGWMTVKAVSMDLHIYDVRGGDLDNGYET